MLPIDFLIKPTLYLSSRNADIFVPLSKVGSLVLRASDEGGHAIQRVMCYNLDKKSLPEIWAALRRIFLNVPF
jgi:hypothetical protein